MELKQLSIQQATEIFEEHMKNDFAPDEIRPIEMIRKLMEAQRYFVYGLYEEEQLRAYAFFLEEENVLLMDYFAVCRGYRDKGYGTKSLKTIIQACRDKKGILIEVEEPDMAEGEELEIRLRRIAFYERCGAQMSNIRTWLFGVDYRIMYVPLADEGFAGFVENSIAMVYQRSLPKELFEKMFQIKGA